MNESPHERDFEGPGASVEPGFVSDDEDEEEPVIFEAASAQATMLTPQAIKAKGGLVNIPKRPPPPPVPPRSSARTSKVITADASSGTSPRKSEFEEVDLHGTDRRSSEAREKEIVDVDMVELAPEDSTVEKGVEEVLPEHHLATSELIDQEYTPNDKETDLAVKLESEEMKAVRPAAHDDESDDFHSVPSTPNAVEVK